MLETESHRPSALSHRWRKQSWKGNSIRLIGVVAILIAFAIALLYLLPLSSDRLQNAEPHALGFDQAMAAAGQALARDANDPEVLPNCRTQALTHPTKTAKAVLMLHGYTACPGDYIDLAQNFYERGYNVYIPRESHHGLIDIGKASQVSAVELADYADSAMNIVAGLGDEVGVIGISGGAALATWLAEYRSDSVSHLLTLAPFYRPDSGQAPRFLIRPLTLLFAHHLLPDHQISGTDFTLRGLAQYLRIVQNYRTEPTNPKLRTVSVAYSSADPYIDRGLASQIPTKIAETNGLKARVHEFGPDLDLGHDILDPSKLGGHRQEIEDLYVDLYEGW